MTFTAKYMNENLKKGWGTAQFSEALGISENEFTSLLEKTFSTATRSLKGFQRKLRQNDHFQKKGDHCLYRRKTDRIKREN